MKQIFTAIALLLTCAGNAQFLGGSGDGFSVDAFEESESLYAGGKGDGASFDLYTSSPLFYRGSSGDGYGADAFESTTSIYRGNAGDGFSASTLLYYHRWTGDVGTGWLISGNWQDNMIPTEDMRVLVPAGAPSMPAINAGTFKIGTGTGADFTCKALWIEPGASILGRINAFIENHSEILIEGTFRWKNQAAESFINKPGSVIEVRDGGVLRTDF